MIDWAINIMNYDYEAGEANIIETVNKMRYADAGLKNLIFKVFDLIIMFFINFIN